MATTEANCLGTTNLLTAAEETGVEKTVVTSSLSVYGLSESLPKREEMPVNSVSPYAFSKYWTEQLAIQFSDYFDIDTIALRFFNIYQDARSEYAVVPTFIERMLNRKRSEIYGDGEQSRDFTYVDNVVDADLKALASDCISEAMNVACSDRIIINELVAQLNEFLGTDINPSIRTSVSGTSVTQKPIFRSRRNLSATNRRSHSAKDLSERSLTFGKPFRSNREPTVEPDAVRKTLVGR